MAGPEDARPRVALETARPLKGCLVTAARGELTPATVVPLRTGLEKLLAEGRPVLLDVSRLRLTWAPGPEVFVTAVTAAGGWPAARMVLFGADPAARRQLTACRVAESVPLADTVTRALDLVGVRPARLFRTAAFAADAEAVGDARRFVRETLARWELPVRADADTVATELADNAVRHARTRFQLRLILDDRGLRISARDWRPGPMPDAHGLDPHPPGGAGLRRVGRLSRSWGVLHFADGKAVWAVLPHSPRARDATAGPLDRVPHLVDARPEPVPGEFAGRPMGPAVVLAATTVTAPRRQHYATADPEQAHDFLRALHGGHTPQLAVGEDFRGFQLEYEGHATNRFTVERLSHTMPFEGGFDPAAVLLVARPVAGELRVAAHGLTGCATPDDVLLVDGGEGRQVGWPHLTAEVVRLDSAAVSLVVADLAGVDPAVVRFDVAKAVSPARAAFWTSAVRHLRDDVLSNDEVMASPLSRSMAFRQLVATLVETFPNAAADALAATDIEGAVAPAAVRRAVAFIEEHAGEDIALADIAQVARIGPRGLQLAFRRHHDMTPLEYLRRVRLARAHQDLQRGNPVDDTVGAIASRWGFAHHGNFSAAYLRAYGHSPGITLRG